MPPGTDWTDVLPAVDASPQRAMPAAGPPLHERLRPVALAFAWETAIASLAVAHLLMGLLVWAVWNAR